VIAQAKKKKQSTLVECLEGHSEPEADRVDVQLFRAILLDQAGKKRLTTISIRCDQEKTDKDYFKMTSPMEMSYNGGFCRVKFGCYNVPDYEYEEVVAPMVSLCHTHTHTHTHAHTNTNTHTHIHTHTHTHTYTHARTHRGCRATDTRPACV